MHTYFQSNQDGQQSFSISMTPYRQVLECKLCFPNHVLIRDADWFKCHFGQLYFKADWSEIHFLSLPLFPLQLKTCCFYLAYTCKEALSSNLMKIVSLREGGRERERSIKAAEKYPSATIAASMHLTGATVVDSVNATEFC